MLNPEAAHNNNSGRPAAIEAEGLTKRFGEFTAVDALDLQVETGTVVSLLGPNGAGKTTMVRMLATLLRPDGGSARIAGHDVVGEAEQVRRVISLTGQFAALDKNLTARENLALMARLRGHCSRRRENDRRGARSSASTSRSSATGSSRTCPAASAAAWTSPRG